jgi:hypothetical protein
LLWIHLLKDLKEKRSSLFTYIGRDDAWMMKMLKILFLWVTFEELFEADKDSWEGYGQLVINTEENESLYTLLIHY